MALTTIITGRVPITTDHPFKAAELVFTLSDWDKAGADIFPPAAVRSVLLTADGTIPVGFALWRNSAGARSTTYHVTARWTEDDRQRQAIPREVLLGKIYLTGPGPVALAELLAIPAPAPTVPDALAQALGAAASAQAAAASTQPVLEDRRAAEAARDEARAAAGAAAADANAQIAPAVSSANGAATRAEAAADAALGAAGWDQSVPDEAARLALTGLPDNWRVYQIAPAPGRIWRWTGTAWADTGENPLGGKVGFSDGIAKTPNTKTLWGGPNASLISRDDFGKIMLQLHDYSIRQTLGRAQELGLIPPDVLHLNPTRSPGFYAGNPQVMLWGLNPDGEFDAVRPSQRFADMLAARLPNSNPFDPVASKLFPSLDLSFVGDSMTTGNWVNVVASMLGGRATIVQQKGGFTSPGMEVVCGIAPLTIGAVAGGSVPADGSPVAVGSKSINILSSGGTFGGTARGYFASSGISNSCILTSDSAGNWTIKREIAGASIPVPDGTTFILHPTLGTPNIPATSPPRGRVRVLRLGRNGVKGTHAARMDIRDSILRHIDYADARQMQAVVISIYNQFKATEASGTVAYNNIMETNRLIQEAVGGQIFLDMRKAAVLTAVEEMGLSPDADDLAARAVDCIPDRFFSDSTHMTAAFQAQFEGPFVARALMARGY